MPSTILPEAPEGVQAMSLLGEELRAGTPNEMVLENLAAAKAEYDHVIMNIDVATPFEPEKAKQPKGADVFSGPLKTD